MGHSEPDCIVHRGSQGSEQRKKCPIPQKVQKSKRFEEDESYKHAGQQKNRSHLQARGSNPRAVKGAEGKQEDADYMKKHENPQCTLIHTTTSRISCSNIVAAFSVSL